MPVDGWLPAPPAAENVSVVSVPAPSVGGVEPEKLRQEWHQKHGGDTENRGKGNRGGDIFRLGADGGGRSGNGGIAADGIAAGNQRRELGREAEHPPGGIADDQ